MSFGDVIKDVAALMAEANKWDKNKQQEKFLKELRKINRILLKQEKYQRRNLILGIVLSSLGSVFLGYMLTGEGQESFRIFINYVPDNGVYDESIYKSYSGGFFVKTPSISWDFKDVEDFQKKLEIPVNLENLIDGIVIHSPRTDSILVVNVFSPTDAQLINLKDEVMKSFENVSPFFDVAKFRGVGNNPEGWLEFEGDRTTKDILTYTKFKFKIYNDKLYVIQSHLVHSASFNEKEEQDLNTAWDSFEFCSSSVNCND